MIDLIGHSKYQGESSMVSGSSPQQVYLIPEDPVGRRARRLDGQEPTASLPDASPVRMSADALREENASLKMELRHLRELDEGLARWHGIKSMFSNATTEAPMSPASRTSTSPDSTPVAARVSEQLALVNIDASIVGRAQVGETCVDLAVPLKGSTPATPFLEVLCSLAATSPMGERCESDALQELARAVWAEMRTSGVPMQIPRTPFPATAYVKHRSRAADCQAPCPENGNIRELRESVDVLVEKLVAQTNQRRKLLRDMQSSSKRRVETVAFAEAAAERLRQSLGPRSTKS